MRTKQLLIIALAVVICCCVFASCEGKVSECAKACGPAGMSSFQPPRQGWQDSVCICKEKP